MARTARQACPRCGTLVTNPKEHMGKGPCRAAQAARRVGNKGLVPLGGKVDADLRYALEHFQVPHEVAPVVYDAGMRRHSSQKNALCVPAWVAALVEIGATERIDPFDAVRKAMFRGEEFRNALVTTAALGGVRAVTQYLHDEGFFDDA